ncbi:hypothetical protein [Catellatospora sp. IY07-71]|uniref:hypothetical protein n=1 Tax=Catellatospora sp. IY07-71 TaxID=2728827 RepID=UPI001BB35800|nr:hypothetical protein [Catellatospora sp. IY07-71]
MPWWRLPLSAEPYRYALFLVLSVPLAVWAVVDGGEAQRLVATALLRREPRRSRLYGLAAVPIDVVALAVTGYCWIGVVVNLAYPTRPLFGMSGEYRDSWGGPTLAGAWAVHALAGIVFLLIVPWILRAYVAVWRRVMGA